MTASQRADAQRNRERLIDAAAAAFAESGTCVALDRIAQLAGVGIGTLYRHFPSRDSLIEAVYRRELAALAETVAPAIATHDGIGALGAWMDHFLDYAAAKRGMGDAIKNVVAATPDLRGAAFELLHGSLGHLIAAGTADGTIRSDARADDILRAMAAIFLIPDELGWRDQAQRLLHLLLDGLRPR